MTNDPNVNEDEIFSDLYNKYYKELKEDNWRRFSEDEMESIAEILADNEFEDYIKLL